MHRPAPDRIGATGRPAGGLRGAVAGSRRLGNRTAQPRLGSAHCMPAGRVHPARSIPGRSVPVRLSRRVPRHPGSGVPGQCRCPPPGCRPRRRLSSTGTGSEGIDLPQIPRDDPARFVPMPPAGDPEVRAPCDGHFTPLQGTAIGNHRMHDPCRYFEGAAAGLGKWPGRQAGSARYDACRLARLGRSWGVRIRPGVSHNAPEPPPAAGASARRRRLTPTPRADCPPAPASAVAEPAA